MQERQLNSEQQQQLQFAQQYKKGKLPSKLQLETV